MLMGGARRPWNTVSWGDAPPTSWPCSCLWRAGVREQQGRRKWRPKQRAVVSGVQGFATAIGGCGGGGAAGFGSHTQGQGGAPEHACKLLRVPKGHEDYRGCCHSRPCMVLTRPTSAAARLLLLLSCEALGVCCVGSLPQGLTCSLA